MKKALLHVRRTTGINGQNSAGAKVLLLLALLAFVPLGSHAAEAGWPGGGSASSQQAKQPVSGVIVDKSGAPLIGVNVIESPTNGTSTDENGRFTISASPSSVLQITYLGYITQEIPVGNQTSFKITMQENAETLDEVVVVGYGTQKKVSVTGAVASVSTEDLKQSSAANLSSALAGRLPGLAAIQTSGQPGYDDVKLYLRGAGTTNGAEPLILIDGVPRSGINTLDPNEVASVSILKDASATAVFGVRGANGVILITTRRGSVGKMELSVSADFSMQSFAAKRTDRLHSWEYAEYRNQAERNSGIPEDRLSYTDYMIQKYKDGSDRVWYPDRDIWEETFKDFAPQTRVNATITGGTEKLQYFVNVAYLNQGSPFKTESESALGYDPGFKLNRYSFTSNLDYQVTKGLKAFLNLRSNIQKIHSPAMIVHNGMDHVVNDQMQLTWHALPSAPGPLTVEGYGVPAGELVMGDTGGDAYRFRNRMGYRMTTNSNLNASLGFDWDLGFITKGLSTKLMVSYDAFATSTIQGQRDCNQYEFLIARDETGVSQYTPKVDNASDAINLIKAFSSNYYLNVQYSINYARTFGKHEVTGMALLQRDNWQTGNPDLPYNMVGVSGRVTYGFDQRYMADINLGYNGSEQFAPGKRFGFFPAVSVGWMVSNENFLKNSRVITNLKLRASYGKVGNDKLGDVRFLYISDIQQVGGLIPSLGRGTQISQGKLGNSNLGWEIAKKQNYGIDLQLFGDLSLTADYFIEKRDGILISRGTVPIFQGVALGNLPKVNMGKVTNRGYELELTYTKAITKDLSIMLKGNYAYNKNIQDFMDEAMLTEEYAYRYRKTGYSIGQCFGYLRDFSNGNGYINSAEELASLPTYQIGNPRVGDFKYLDLNGDGFINEKDQAPIGYADIPRVNYGFSLGLNYKWFDFSILFQGIGKSSRMYAEQGVFETPQRGFYSGYIRNAWTPERYASGAKIEYPALSTSSNSNHLANDFFIMDRSYLRLKNIELGYTLPQGALKALGVSKLRVYVSGENLVTWSNLRMDWIDPEQGNAMSYPINKMINFGVNITF